MDNIIELKNVTKSFKTPRGRLDVLNGINLEIAKGEMVAITGKSGSGKSTLLNIIGFMERCDGGSYGFNGRDTAALNENERCKLRAESIGFIYQGYNLIPVMTALENVELPLGYRGVGKVERRSAALEMLGRVGISERAHHLPADMSGGEQQRTAIARAVISNPLLILADEPTGNLDEKNGVEIMELLTGLNAGGTTVVMVTHDSDMLRYASRVISVRSGKIE